jgi:hypothetical protein
MLLSTRSSPDAIYMTSDLGTGEFGCFDDQQDDRDREVAQGTVTKAGPRQRCCAAPILLLDVALLGATAIGVGDSRPAKARQMRVRRNTPRITHDKHAENERGSVL